MSVDEASVAESSGLGDSLHSDVSGCSRSKGKDGFLKTMSKSVKVAVVPSEVTKLMKSSNKKTTELGGSTSTLHSDVSEHSGNSTPNPLVSQPNANKSYAPSKKKSGITLGNMFTGKANGKINGKSTNM